MIKNPSKDLYDVIVLAGQSNMQGNGLGPSLNKEWQIQPEIMMLKGEFNAKVAQAAYGNEYLEIEVSDEYEIVPAQERNNGGVIAAVLGNYFAEFYKKNDLEKGRKILLIQTAVGGTGFAKRHWGLNDVLYKRLVNMTKQALEMNSANRLVAFLWHQGEHDAFEPLEMGEEERRQTYKKNLAALIGDYRLKFGVQPFVCANFSKFWVDDYPVQCRAIISAIKEVVKNTPKAAFVENTFDLEVNDQAVGNGDAVHFSRRANEILAKRYYEEYIKLK